MVNVAKSMTVVHVDPANIHPKFIRKIQQITKVLSNWDTFISKRDNTYLKGHHRRLSNKFTGEEETAMCKRRKKMSMIQK